MLRRIYYVLGWVGNSIPNYFSFIGSLDYYQENKEKLGVIEPFELPSTAYRLITGKTARNIPKVFLNGIRTHSVTGKKYYDKIGVYVSPVKLPSVLADPTTLFFTNFKVASSYVPGQPVRRFSKY